MFPSIRVKSIAIKRRPCPACSGRWFVRLADDETAVRCLRCRATPVHLAVIEAVQHVSLPRNAHVYEMSSRGALLGYLRRTFGNVVASEYFEGIAPGTFRDDVRCEDVQNLSLPDESLELCTSTEVFEHVPDDMAGFREIHRVLKPGGLLIFTVPLTDAAETVERARKESGKIVHLLPPAFHGDRIKGRDKVLVFRDYGRDIRARLLAAGFRTASMVSPENDYFGYSRKAVAALK